MSERNPIDALEDALIDAAGSAFLVDQFVTHGEHTDDAEKALHHVNRLLSADMKALRRAFDVLHAAERVPRRAKGKGRAKPTRGVVVPLVRPETPDDAA